MSTDTLPADAPAWAQVLFAEIVHVKKIVSSAQAQTPAPDATITANAADRLYHLREGTARATWDLGDGRLKGQLRKGRSPTGLVLYLDKADCDRLWRR